MASSSSIGCNLQNMEKNLLRTNKDDAFRFIQILFSVAATRWPQDLCSRRSQIMDNLYAPTQQQQQDDHHHHHRDHKPTPPPTAAAEKDSSPPVNKERENRKNTKIITVCATRDIEQEENNSSKLEASIDKLNAQYRAAQVNRRKIQVVEEFHTHKKKKKNNFITKLRKEAKKANPTTKILNKKQFRRPPRTLTSWIDSQTRTSLGFW